MSNTNTNTNHVYNSDDARRAVLRHERRSPEERTELAVALICSLANDDAPIYTGIDPDTGRNFQGPALYQYVLETAAYHVASRLLRRGVTREGIVRHIMRHIENGVGTAVWHHGRA